MARKLPLSSPSSLSLLVFVLYIAYQASASVHDYTKAKFVSRGNAFVLHGGSEGLYASIPRPNASGSAASGDSFIRFEKITLRRPEEAAPLNKIEDSIRVHAVIFEVKDRDTIGGSAYGGQKAICCTTDLAKLGACTHGNIIYRPSSQNPDWPQIFSSSFTGKNAVATLPSQTLSINKTGTYNLYFIFCDPALKGLVIEGKTVWKNPTGYLPGRMAPLLNFYGLLSLAFAILGIFWFSQYARFLREVLPLQNCITLVIALGMFEMALLYFEYAEFNKTGVRPMCITFWAVTFGTIKRSVARIIILLVSMGYVGWSLIKGADARGNLFSSLRDPPIGRKSWCCKRFLWKCETIFCSSSCCAGCVLYSVDIQISFQHIRQAPGKKVDG